MVMLDFAVDELDGGKLSTACGERLFTQEQNLFKTTFYLHCLQIGMIFTINTCSHVENEKLATQNISGLHQNSASQIDVNGYLARQSELLTQYSSGLIDSIEYREQKNKKAKTTL